MKSRVSMERAVDTACGALLGLACGDALGRPVEFSTPARIERQYGTLDEMVGDGTHGQPAGAITDDTELALRVCRSLVDHSGFNGADVAQRFVEWYRSDPFDIGFMTADALRAIDDGASWREAGHTVWESSSEGSNAGNGSLMRCAPYAILYARSPIELDAVSRRSSAITHADPRCTRACSVLNRILATLLLIDDEAARGLSFDPVKGVVENPLFGIPDALEAALRPGLEGLSPDDLENSGYVVTTLQAGLYYGLTADSTEEAIVTAVNAGGDTDTIGAVAGAVAGARFGMSDLPERWLRELDHAGELGRIAQKLYDLREASTTANDKGPTPPREKPKPATYLSRRHEPPIPDGVELPPFAGGHRPRPEPRYLPNEPPTDLSPTDVIWFDWMARMHLSVNYGYPIHKRSTDDADRFRTVEQVLKGALRVRLPEYTTATTINDLPERDRNRLEQLFKTGTDSLQEAGDSILEVRSESGIGHTHLHGYLAAAARNAPFLSDQLIRNASVTDPHLDELLETTQKFVQLTSTYLEVFAMLDETQDEVEMLVDMAGSAHETAHRAHHYFTAFGLRHPAIDEASIEDGLARRQI